MKSIYFAAFWVLLPVGALGLRAQAPVTPAPELVWVDVKDLGLEGKGWSETKSYFDRLPARAEKLVVEPVWRLSRNSAGLCVRFVTTAPTIVASWTLTTDRLARPHMAATAMSGLDLYVRAENGNWRWLAIGPPSEFPTNTAILVRALPAIRREYLLYLPLYNGVTEVKLGTPSGFQIEPAPPRPTGKARPIVFYGTSITQGQAASRCGMVHTAILGRHFDRPVINLGFSGNGHMEPAMADLIAELDPAVFFLDCVPNMPGALLTERVEPFVHTLRKKHPETAIVLAEDRSYAGEFWLADEGGANQERRAALRSAYERLVAAGDKNLYYVPGETLTGVDGEATIDGSHLTDLGFYRQAAVFEQALRELISKEERIVNQGPP